MRPVPWVFATVDGSEIRRSPVEGTVVEIPLFTRFGIHPRWCRISAIKSNMARRKDTLFFKIGDTPKTNMDTPNSHI